jgi:hypothetical protein
MHRSGKCVRWFFEPGHGLPETEVAGSKQVASGKGGEDGGKRLIPDLPEQPSSNLLADER